MQLSQMFHYRLSKFLRSPRTALEHGSCQRQAFSLHVNSKSQTRHRPASRPVNKGLFYKSNLLMLCQGLPLGLPKYISLD